MARIILVALLLSLVSYGYSAPTYYNDVQKLQAPIETPVIRQETVSSPYQQVVETTTPALEIVPSTNSYKAVETPVEVPIQQDVQTTTVGYGKNKRRLYFINLIDIF